MSTIVLGHLDALLRGPVLGWMGRSDQATLARARKRFEAHCKCESTIPAYLRAAVYSTVLRHGVVNTLRLWSTVERSWSAWRESLIDEMYKSCITTWSDQESLGVLNVCGSYSFCFYFTFIWVQNLDTFNGVKVFFSETYKSFHDAFYLLISIVFLIQNSSSGLTLLKALSYKDIHYSWQKANKQTWKLKKKTKKQITGIECYKKANKTMWK